MNRGKSLDEVKAIYGAENLVCIVNLKQLVLYCKTIQPVWVAEGYNGKLTCWFVKSDTKECWDAWLRSNPVRRENEQI